MAASPRLVPVSIAEAARAEPSRYSRCSLEGCERQRKGVALGVWRLWNLEKGGRSDL